MRRKAVSSILFVAVAATLIGCSDNPTGPASPNVPDVAALLAEMSSTTLSGAASIASPMIGPSFVSGTIQLGTDVLPIDQTINETTTNLVLPNAKAGQRWPQSGTITIETVLGTNPSSGMAKTQITFNGTSVVTITFGTTTCHVDLSNPAGGLSSCTVG